jgi:CspA family cold shock protein
MQGIIKNLRLDKGFGFITPSEGGKDVFFHASDLKDIDFDSLTTGTVVSFEMGESAKGPKAVNVVIISEGNEE